MESNNFSQQEILDFKNISQKLGSNSSLVQAAGGNTSMKSSGSMLIKASGTWLVNSNLEEIFVEVNFQHPDQRFRMDAHLYDVKLFLV